MSDFFGKLISKISADAGFPIMAYEPETKTMLRFSSAGGEKIPVPHLIASDLDKNDIVFDLKTVGDKNFIVYFLRCIFGGKKYVIVINDIPSRAKLGRFFYAMASVLRDMNGNRDALTERIRILKESLDIKIREREEASASLASCENEMHLVMQVRDEAISRLKYQIEENKRLQAETGGVVRAVKSLESKVREKEEDIAKLKQNFEERLKKVPSKEEYEARIAKVLSVRNEAVMRLKSQIEETERVKAEAGGVAEAVKRLEMQVREKEAESEKIRAEFTEKLKAASDPAQYEARIAQAVRVRNEAIERLKSLMAENERLKLSFGGNSDVVARLQGAVKQRDEEIEQLTKNIQEKNEIVKAKDAKIAKTRFYLEEMTELVKVVKKSRDKIMTLTDFITVPMYSVSGERSLVHANNALAAYVKSANVAKIVGKSCYKLVFGFDKPCPWCQLEKVQKTGSSITVGVMVNDGSKRKNIELTIFPILDSTGTLIDCGEFIVDKTDTFELAQSLKKFKEQVMSFKRAKISGMNEIQDVKQAYDELSANYDMVVARNAKLSQALESLLVQDNNKEVINAKNEAAEYKASLHRYQGIVGNYKRNLEELQTKYTTLNKQTFFQIERLINVAKSRSNVDMNEIIDMLANIGIDFQELSRVLGRE